MPRTPLFTIAQSADVLTFTIETPYVKASDAEVVVDGQDFSFYCKPFLLRLRMPEGCELLDEGVSAKFDPLLKHGTIVVTVPKADKGKHFPDLDLISKLFLPKPQLPMQSQLAQGAGAVGGGGAAGLTEVSTQRLGGGAAAAGAAGEGEEEMITLGAPEEEEEEDEEDIDGANAEETLSKLFMAKGSFGLGLGQGGAGLGSNSASTSRAAATGSRPLIEVVSSTDFPVAAGEEGTVQQTGGAAAGRGQGAAAAAGALAGGASEQKTQEPEAARPAPFITQAAAAAAPSLGRGREEEEEDGSSAPSLLPSLLLPSDSSFSYGFNRGHRGAFPAERREDLPDTLQLPQPDSTPAALRCLLRTAHENSCFDPDRYASDWLEGEGGGDYVLLQAVRLIPHWMRPPAAAASAGDKVAAAGAAAGGGAGDSEESKAAKAGGWQWTEQEQQELAALSNRELLVDGDVVGGRSKSASSLTATPSSASPSLPLPCSLLQAEQKPEQLRILCSLIALLFAYCYDTRCTGGESSTESSWAMATLAAPLSWLDDEMKVESLPEGSESGEEVEEESSDSDSDDSSSETSSETSSSSSDSSSSRSSGSSKGRGRTAAGGAGEEDSSGLIDLRSLRAPACSPSSSSAKPLALAPTSGMGLVAVESRQLQPSISSSTTPAAAAGAGIQPASPSTASSAAPLASPAPAPSAPCCTAFFNCAAVCMRRALCFPYLRRWDLAELCLRDVCLILGGAADPAGAAVSGGLRPALRCLLSMRRIFSKDEGRYILNALLLDEMCLWLQKACSGEGSSSGEQREVGAPPLLTLASLHLGQAIKQLQAAKNSWLFQFGQGMSLGEIEQCAAEMAGAEGQGERE